MSSTIHTPASSTADSLVLRACPLCESHESSPVFEGIRRCSTCGLTFVNPLGNFRGENESEEYFIKEYLPLHQNNWQNSLGERRAHLAMIRGYTSLPASPRLLDVGCALGFMLKEATSAGWDATGVETSQFAARYAIENTGCRVHVGTLQRAHLESDSFDVITLMDVIEHLPEPCALMSEVYRVLRPGGVAFLVTPNFASLFVWLFGKQAYGIGPEEHVSYFEPRTMEKTLRHCGFRNILIGTKDFYAANIARLLGRNKQGPQPEIKNAFGSNASLGTVRQFANRVLMHVPIGDKLLALAQK